MAGNLRPLLKGDTSGVTINTFAIKDSLIRNSCSLIAGLFSGLQLDKKSTGSLISGLEIQGNSIHLIEIQDSLITKLHFVSSC